MDFYEKMQVVYNILCFIVIPVVVCGIIGWVRPKIIWIAPLFIWIGFFIVSAIFFPYYFEDIFAGEYDFTTMYWIIFYFPAQVITALLYTGITYLIVLITKKRRKKP